jgi:opacity protein-like surface antigen
VTKTLYQAALAALFLVGLLPQGAMAQFSSGLYGELRFGASFVDDADFEELGVTGELSYDAIAALDLAFGTSFDMGLRLEYQFGFRGAEIDTVEIDGLGTFGGAADLWTYTNMLNVYYDFDFGRVSGGPAGSSRLVPYIGGGVGLAIHELDFDSGGSESDTVFAYQGIAGLAYSFNPNWGMTLSYLFIGSSDPKFQDFETEYRSHNVMLGVRYSF